MLPQHQQVFHKHPMHTTTTTTPTTTTTTTTTAVPYVIPSNNNNNRSSHPQPQPPPPPPPIIPTQVFYKSQPPPTSLWNMMSSPTFCLPESPVGPKQQQSTSFHKPTTSTVFRPVNQSSGSPTLGTTKKRKLVKRSDLEARGSSSTPPPTTTPLPPTVSSLLPVIQTLVKEFPGLQHALISRTVSHYQGDWIASRAHCQRVAKSSHLSARLNTLNPVTVNASKVTTLPSAQSNHTQQTFSSQSVKRRSLRSRKSLDAASTKQLEIGSDAESDLQQYSSHDDDDSDLSENEKVKASKRLNQEEDTVLFFNTATATALVEYTQGTLDQAEVVLGLRPFSSELDIYNKLVSTKGLSNRMLENYEAVSDALIAVDGVIKECEQISIELAECMQSWPNPSAIVIDQTSPMPPNLLSKQPDWINKAMTLKSYQVIGVSWLVLLHQRNLSGILADDMGLGKTAQVIAYILHMHEQGNKGPFLVICPSSTLDNWMREFERWVCPDKFGAEIRVEAYAGSASERYARGKQLLFSGDVSVVVTTYSFANAKDDRAFLRKMQFKAMIADEGHFLKNAESQRFKALNQVKAPFRLLLTGTPLQNNLTELLSLLTFILPNLFAPVETEWRRLLKLKSIDAISSNRLLQVRKVMEPFILRRKKLQVLTDLPPKSIRIQECQMHGYQQELYTQLVAASCADLVNGESKKFKAHFMDLRKAAIHPLLFRRLYSDLKCREIGIKLLNEHAYRDGNLEYMVEDMLLYSDFDIHKLCLKFDSTRKYALQADEWMDSAKVQQLALLLKSCQDRRDRCLLFSQFTMALDILENVLHTLGYKYLRIDGTTSVVERQPLIDQFYEEADIFVFLLSTKAGGQGLNLAAANVVILHDLDFNPHNDNQAEDRSWRIGQTRPVEVIKLVCTGTIEEAIVKSQHMKLRLDHKLANASEEAGEEEEEEEEVMDDGACEREIMRLVACQLGGSNSSVIGEENL